MATSSSSSSRPVGEPLEETLVLDAFHALLQEALIQAQAENLLTTEDVNRGGPDLKIIAPSLALYFAALQAHGDPPALDFPSNRASQLSQSNCPSSFASYFQLWQICVRKVQRLDLDNRHDLALLLCEKEPVSSPIRMDVVALASDLKAVAVTIVQRSTFQSRFQEDVQQAVEISLQNRDSGEAQYIAPPPSRSSPASFRQGYSRTGSYRPLPPPPLPTIAIEPPAEETETLMLIRETLFAALGDCLATNQDLLSLLGARKSDKSWSSRCYFASLCLAILDVCLLRVQLPSQPDMKHITAGNRSNNSFPWHEAYVRTVHVANLPDRVTLETCPQELSKLLIVVFRIAMFVQALSASDDMRAMQAAADDMVIKDEELYLFRLKRRLLGDVAATSHIDATEIPGTEHDKEAAVMINRLALAMFEIPSFRQRQTEAFAILGAITSV